MGPGAEALAAVVNDRRTRGEDDGADLVKPLEVEVGGVGPVDHLERLVITGGELFKSCLGDEGNLDVGSCRKLNKSVAQAGLKTMQ